MRSQPAREAVAYAPGHVTGVFVPETSARDPRGRGSVGAGLVLDAGATARAAWWPAAEPSVRVTGDSRRPLEISTEVARRLLAVRPGQLRVQLRHDLPIGQGFGMSAAGATATGLAVARVVGASRPHAVETAHLADLFGGGGLGGVAAILGGGFEVRRSPGIPPFGQVVRRLVDEPVLIGQVERPIPSPEVLHDPRRLARIRAAAQGLGGLQRSPSLDGFWELSEAFTDRAGLLGRDLGTVLRGLRKRGARAAQAMFGGCFFARLPRGTSRTELLAWLRSLHLSAVELPVARTGARLLRERPR